MDMISQGGSLCFGRDGFEWELGAAVDMIFEKEVVCMIVDDGK